MKIRWWNVNGRWPTIDKNFMNETDIIFLSETHAIWSALPTIPNFNCVGDPSAPLLSAHGGLAVYISSVLFTHLQEVRFSKCTISLKFDFIADFCFMGVCIYPADSRNFTDLDFGLFSSDIEHWINKGVTPIIGCDINTRIADLNILSQKSLRWRYNKNIDTETNQHYKYFENICEYHRILPINHSLYYDTIFDGDFTYHKGGKKSQIDFLITNNQGRRIIKKNSILRSDWHMSDHLPIVADLQIPIVIDSGTLLIRSKELKPYIPSQQPLLRIHRYDFNTVMAGNMLQVRANELTDKCSRIHDDPDEIVSVIEDEIIPILTKCKMPKTREIPQNETSNQMVICNSCFNTYLDTLKNSNNEDEINQSYLKYQCERRKLNKVTLNEHENCYRAILQSKDDKKLWDKINWSGSLESKGAKGQPLTSELAEHFEELYQPPPDEDVEQIKNLTSNVYIPITDDPITPDDISNAAKQMKKGGWDYSLAVLNILLTVTPLCLLHLMNIIFFLCYPFKLCLSLLSAIPKKGNLLLVTNFRGIQMQPLLALLYDRIIASRLISWAKVSPEQTAFQKGKGTLDQIFLLRVIIALAKRHKKSLYVGLFDLSKTFDKVSRVELLKCLVKMGVGSCMLEALKGMYSCTRCVLKNAGKLSDVFFTYSGIKQGAPSSVILFIIFMDSVINILKEKCANEFIINSVHCLLHADDTLIMSLDFDNFINKCNVLVESFRRKKLSMNMSKSAYIVINPPADFVKVDCQIDGGWLPYQSSVVYLGAVISDTGLVSNDVVLQAQTKYKTISIKLANFITNHMSAPVTVKTKVLNTSVNASILYSCETWGPSSLAKIETLHRKAIKTSLSLKKTIPNDILYIESGLVPLLGSVYKRQYKFWSKILRDIDSDPHSPVSQIYQHAIDRNLPYVKHYRKLHEKFNDAEECMRYYNDLAKTSNIQNIRTKAGADPDGIQGTYVKINPLLVSPQFYHEYTCREYEREILTKYRTGGHRLRIQTGRFQDDKTNERVCKCKQSIQTLEHVVFECMLTECIRDNNFYATNLEEFFITCKVLLKN